MTPRAPLLMSLLLLASLAAPALRAETGGAEQEAAADLPPRPVVSVIVNPISALPVSWIGIVTARIETDLGFPVAGTVAVRPVETGAQVAGGTVLARLDPEDLDADLRAAEAGVTVATAQARSAGDARDRARELASRGVGSETRLEDAERALVAAEARLEQARAATARAADMRARATLTAPFDGVVTGVFAEPGATLASGAPVLRLASTVEREVVIDLAEEDAAALGPDSAFTVTLAANPEVKATARFARIDPVAERSTRTRRLHLSLDGAAPSFRLGALTRVAPAVSAAAGIVLPVSAVLPGDEVWVVDRGDNSVTRRKITTAGRIEGYVLVAAGLSAGDEVVTRGIHRLSDGQVVGRSVAP